MKIKLYFIALFTFLAIDSVWLSLTLPTLYLAQIGHLMAEDANFLAAGIFYLLYIFGLLTFVIEPAIKTESLKQASLRGALFGLITYATYDLTNFATLENWSLLITVVDMAWGTILGGLVTLISVWAGKKLSQ